MRLLRRYNVKASSVGEAVVAMALVAISLSMATSIYASVLNSADNLSSFEAEQKLKELIWETGNANSFENEDYDFKDFKINKTVEEIGVNMYLVEFRILNSQHNKLVTVIMDGN